MALRLARPVLLNSWINASATKARMSRVVGRYRPQPSMWDDIHGWLDQHVAGRSFVDVGGMWGDKWGAFDAADRGASPVVMLDVTPPTESCLAEQERRGADVRYVTGDLHDERTLEQVGVHDIVLCSGVLYHVPDPCLTLERLRSITSGHLLLATQTTQEIPGIPHSAVFYPYLSDEQRKAFAAHIGGVADGLTTPFDPALDYSNWWWGFSRSALRAMLEATGWNVVEETSYTVDTGYITYVVARPIPDAPTISSLVAAGALTTNPTGR